MAGRTRILWVVLTIAACGDDSSSADPDASSVDAAGDATGDSAIPTDCGDGALDPPVEECDDGNTTAGDGCDATCQLEPVGASCGNTPDPGETCDDGNTNNGDGCNPTCNFLTKVTQLGRAPGNVLTSDGTYLYAYGMGGNCQIHRATIAQCMPGSCAFTPFVGAGCMGAPADGPGATAVLGAGAGGLAFGAGKLFFSDEHTIRAIDLASATLDVTTIAGASNRCGQLDAIGTMAVMSDIRGMAYYNGLLYFVDANMATLRQVDPSTGQVTTIAGQTPNDNSGSSYSCAVNLCCGRTGMASDGQGTAATMNSPRYLAGDNSGSLFLIDTNGSAIRRYDTTTTMLSTIISGVGYADGMGAAVRLDRPRGITSDGTSIYFGEQTENTIRQVEVGSARTTTFVGVRGCAGPLNVMGGIGGDGSRSWAGTCNAAAVNMKPQFAVGTASLAFDFGTRSIYAIANGTLLRIE